MIDIKKPLELFNPNPAALSRAEPCSLIAVSPTGLIVIEHNLNGSIGGVAIFTSDGASYKSCPAWTLRNKAPKPLTDLAKAQAALRYALQMYDPHEGHWPSASFPEQHREAIAAAFKEGDKI